MPLTLSDKDLSELQQLLGDFRHKEASALIRFFSQKETQQRVEAKKAEAGIQADAPVPHKNGHDANPYQAQA